MGGAEMVSCPAFHHPRSCSRLPPPEVSIRTGHHRLGIARNPVDGGHSRVRGFHPRGQGPRAPSLREPGGTRPLLHRPTGNLSCEQSPASSGECWRRMPCGGVVIDDQGHLLRVGYEVSAGHPFEPVQDGRGRCIGDVHEVDISVNMVPWRVPGSTMTKKARPLPTSLCLSSSLTDTTGHETRELQVATGRQHIVSTFDATDDQVMNRAQTGITGACNRPVIGYQDKLEQRRRRSVRSVRIHHGIATRFQTSRAVGQFRAKNSTRR